MRIIVSATERALKTFGTDPERVRNVLRTIADGTDTDRLVVFVALLSHISRWGGACYQRELTALDLGRRKKLLRDHGTNALPPGLPPSFKLIEVNLGSRGVKYPATEHNQNDFKLCFSSFDAHLGYIFAHELHHFRRYHLGLHAREGEKSADKWAAMRTKIAGYTMTLTPCPRKARRLKRRRFRQPKPNAHWDIIRALKPGSPLLVTRSDSRALPAGSIVRFVRSLRGSYRALVRDRRQDERMVPMEWLAPTQCTDTALAPQRDGD